MLCRCSGIPTIRPGDAMDECVRQVLEPYATLTLVLEEALGDGTLEVGMRIEPYEGHWAHGRYQIRVEK